MGTGLVPEVRVADHGRVPPRQRARIEPAVSYRMRRQLVQTLEDEDGVLEASLRNVLASLGGHVQNDASGQGQCGILARAIKKSSMY